MKKLISFLLILSLLLSLGAAALAEGAEKQSYADVGLTLEYPAALAEPVGILDVYSYGALREEPAVYVLTVDYIAASQAEYNELYARLMADEVSEEELDAFRNAKYSMIGVYLVTSLDPDEVMAEILPELAGQYEKLRLGSVEGLDYYYLRILTQDFAAALEAPYREEVEQISALMLEAFRKAEISAPVDPVKAVVGQKLRFTAVDLDGAEHTSEELFSANRYTMVNCWGTWCVWCVYEMEELAALHTRMQEQGCGILGLEVELGSDEATLQGARDLLKEKGVTYPNVLANGDMRFLYDLPGYPTSFFVDSEGVIVLPPIVGAQTAQYEQSFASLLAESETADNVAAAAGNGAGVYRVYVEDAEGPVEGVMVQFCSDELCVFGNTDEHGLAVFEQPAGTVYTVHILKAPAGYAVPEEEFETPDVYGDITIRLEKTA